MVLLRTKNSYDWKDICLVCTRGHVIVCAAFLLYQKIIYAVFLVRAIVVWVWGPIWIHRRKKLSNFFVNCSSIRVKYFSWLEDDYVKVRSHIFRLKITQFQSYVLAVLSPFLLSCCLPFSITFWLWINHVDATHGSLSCSLLLILPFFWFCWFGLQKMVVL